MIGSTSDVVNCRGMKPSVSHMRQISGIQLALKLEHPYLLCDVA